MDALCDDLTAEHDELERLVPPGDLVAVTPAAGWTVADQISHLWFFDQRALLALTDPEAFVAERAALLASLDGGPDPSVEAGRTLAPTTLLDGWRHDRRRLVDHARSLDPKLRVPWYGPAMSARSFITARLMETWAHGQDVADAFGVERAATDRLRHVAHIGVGARRFSYIANGLEPNDEPVLVALAAPSGGDTWTWGPEDAPHVVRGRAVDFCLVVTQRRHRADVDLDVTGRAANEWMDIAQAFAGPPGEGRRPRQFAR